MKQVPTIWSVLGIAPTRDAREIRRAYAQRLKVTHPEDDAEGFKLLRASYEHALQLAMHAAHAEAAAQQQQPQPDAPSPEPERAAAAAAAEPAAPVDPELQSIAALFNEFEAAVRLDTPVNEAAEHQALAALLKSPALERMDIHQRVEIALASLLADRPSRTDHLLATVASSFDWQHRMHESTMLPQTREVMQRISDLEYLEWLRKSDRRQGAAYRNLTGRQAPWWRWLRAYLGSYPAEPQVLQTLQYSHPRLLANVPAETVIWWERFLRDPRPSKSLISLGTTITIWLVIHALTSADDGSQASTVILAGCLGLAITGAIVGFKLFAIDLPSRRIHERWRGLPPAALAVGWLPALLIILFAAVARRETGWPEMCVAGLAVLAWIWTLHVSGPMPDFRWHGRMLEARAVRVVWMNGFVLFWLLMLINVELGFTGYTAISLAFVLLASGIGRPMQVQMYRTQLVWQRRALSAAILLAIAVALGIWSVLHANERGAQAWMVAAAIAVTLLRRTSTYDFTFGEGWFTGAIVVTVGIIACEIAMPFFVKNTGLPEDQGTSMVARGVLFFLGGAVFVLIREIYDALTLKDEMLQNH